MALPHAHLLDVISVRALGAALREAVSTSLLKSERIQLLHLVLPQHHDVPEHFGCLVNAGPASATSGTPAPMPVSPTHQPWSTQGA